MTEQRSMSWIEAMQVMEAGHQVRNEYFTPEEYFEMRDGRIYGEDGCSMHDWYRGEDWQKTGWSVVNKQAA